MIPLNVPKLILLEENDQVEININTGLHKFSPNANYTGYQPNFPIFNSDLMVNNKLRSQMTYGLPFIQMKRNSFQNITFTNYTPYYFNIHFHGFNSNAFLDGTSYTSEFGKETALGLSLNYQFKVYNNSMLSWIHPHVGLMSAPLIYSGLFGMYEITDSFSALLDNFFSYDSNYLILVYSDADLNIDGSLNKRRLNDKNWRAFYGVINGQLCLNWTLGNFMPFYSRSLFYETNKNLFKISLLNGTVSFRTVYLAVCDKNKNLKPFYFIQSDGGFRNPFKTTMLAVCPAERVTIVFDLNDFENGEAVICFYNFDLSYIFNQLENVFLNKEKKLVNLFQQEYNCGQHAMPGIQYLSNTYDVKPFLYIFKREPIPTKCENQSLKTCLTIIKKIVFGPKNIYSLSEQYLNKKYFHYLNQDYYYNLPNFVNTPTRQMIFTMNSYNVPQVTEWVNMQARVYVDMWNSYEYEQWLSTNSDAFLPSCLFKISGESNYINYKYYSNNKLTIFIKNSYFTIDTLNIEFPVNENLLNIKQWTTLVNEIYKKTKINVPNKNYHFLSDILELQWEPFLFENYYLWNDTHTYKDSIFIRTVLMKNVNKSEYTIELNGNSKLLLFFGKCLGAALPGKNMQMVVDIPLKKYGVIGNLEQFLGMWGLMLLYMFLGMTLGMKIGSKLNMLWNVNNMNLMNIGMYVGMYMFMSIEMGFTKITLVFFNLILMEIFAFFVLYYKKLNVLPVIITGLITIFIYLLTYIFPLQTSNNYNMQQIMVTQGSLSGLNISKDKSQIASLTIYPKNSYNGLIDGYMNEFLMNFSVKRNSSEKWLFTNLDNNNLHPLHFHLTSGYADVSEDNNCLLNKDFNHLLYSKDTYALGIQQTLPFYIKFANFDSKQGQIKNLGFFYHCHFMLHHDMNMMGQFYVDV